MIIQIFGTKKCRNSQKAERFFKERNTGYQFIDITEKNLSKGEFDTVKKSAGLENLINTESNEYKKRNLKYMVFDIEEELLNNPLLLKTPVVRFKNKATAGFCPETWKEWLKGDF